MDFIAKIWKDTLKHFSGNSEYKLEAYGGIVTAFLNDTQLNPLKTIDDWVGGVSQKMEAVVTKDDRYGVFLSHQGIKSDGYGGQSSAMKINVSLVKQIYEDKLLFSGNEPVPVFFDNDSMVAGDHQIKAMLFSAYASDQIIAFMDNDFFTKKWCLMEYFLAKHGRGTLRPFLVDSPYAPVLPQDTVYDEVAKDLKAATSGRFLQTLQNYFIERNREDYSSRVLSVEV